MVTSFFRQATLILMAASAATADCTSQVGIALRVQGPGTPCTALTFTVNFARTDATVYLVVGGSRGETDFGVVALCLSWPFAVLPMGPVDSDGSCDSVIPLPPDLQPGLLVPLYAQSAALAPSLLPQENRISPVVPFDVYTVIPPFTVTGIQPSTGPPGTSVEIQGMGFGSDPAQVTVRFDWVPVPPISVTDSSIRVTLPFLPDEQPVPVTVQVGIPRTSGGMFLPLPPPPPASGPVPGWITLGFPNLASVLSPDLHARILTAGGRLAMVNADLRTALCIVPAGQEETFLAAVPGPAGADAAAIDTFTEEDYGMGDPGLS